MASTSSCDSNSCLINDDLINQFCSITGTEREIALRMLEACNGNLQMAINMHVDSETNVSSTNSSRSEEYVRPPIPPTRGVLVEDDFYAVRTPSRKAARSIFDGLRDFQAEAKWQEEEMSANKNCQAYKKRKTLEDLFRPPLDLIHRASFESAREKGQASNKWLMVNVQDVKEFACQVLNRDVWSNAAVKALVKEHFIFWQIYRDSEEGRRYHHFYRVTHFPYIAILDPRTGEKLVAWNNVDSLTLCDLITEFLTQHPSPDGTFSLPKKKKAKPVSETLVDESEEDQMKAAIEASLRDMNSTSTAKNSHHTSDADDEIDDSDIESLDSDYETGATAPSSKRDSKDSKVDSTIVLDSTEEDSYSSCNDHTNSAPLSSSSLPQLSSTTESWQHYLGKDSDPQTELMLRFPDGKREKVSFPSTSQLKALILYTASKGFSQDEYEVITNFPRRELNSLDMACTLQEIGLFPRETVFIQFKNT